MRTYAFMPLRALLAVMLSSRSAPGGADEVRQRRAERRRALDPADTMEIDARAALLRVVGGIEGGGQPRGGLTEAKRERLAEALVAETRDDDVEARGVGVAHVRESRPVAHELDALA